MVKRVPTPPPPDDEPRYLTVTYPFPPSPMLEKHEDLVLLVKWLACAMKGKYASLYAVFHRPSAANMIVIEVDRDFPHYRNLLGAHKWSEFTLHPGPHIDKVSRVFFSSYPNGRAVEKAGWKRIFVEDLWFEGWRPRTDQNIIYPYPISSYCKIPSEDPLSVQICRPLPLDVFGMRVPKTIPPPVPVGSSIWVARKVDNPDKVLEKDAEQNPDPRDFKKAPSYSPLEPIISNDDPTNSTVRQTSSSIFASTDPDTSGMAVTVNNGTIPWFVENDNEEEQRENAIADPNSDDDEGEIYAYGTNAYLTTDHDENMEYGISSQSNSDHPLLANKDKPSCPTHRVKCSPGICSDYKAFIKRNERKLEQEKKRQEAVSYSAKGAGRGKNTWRGDRGQTRGLNNGANTTRTFPNGNRVTRTNGFWAQPKGTNNESSKFNGGFPKPFARIDDKLSGNNEEKSDNASALKEPTTLSTTTSAWAKGNPPASRRANAHFPPLGNEDEGDKLDKVKQSNGRSAVTPPTFAASPGNTNIPGKSSWAKIASQASTPRFAESASASASSEKSIGVIPSSVGPVITSPNRAKPNDPLTVSWVNIMDKEAEEEEEW